MKRLIYSVLALAAMMLTIVSCSNDDAPEEGVKVTFTATVPGYDVQSRADGSTIGDGSKVDKVKCEIYEVTTDANGTKSYVERIEETKDIPSTGERTVTFSPTLLKGRTYDIVFFAYKDGYYDVDDLIAVTRASNQTVLCNDDNWDAFSKVLSGIVAENMGKPDVTLERPLAQLNFGTHDLEDGLGMLENEAIYSGSAIQISAYSTYNVLTGEVVGAASEITFSKNEASLDDLNVGTEKYTRLAMTYLFVDLKNGNSKGSYIPQNCKLTTYYKVDNVESEINTTTYSSVTLKSNTRTNVISDNLLTGTINYVISLDENFAEWGPDENIDLDNEQGSSESGTEE